MKIDKTLSHCDHVSQQVLEFVEQKFRDRTGFFIETIELPPLGQQLTNAIYGPVSGDPPVTEDKVYYAIRKGRICLSRLINAPVRPTNQLTVIAGPSKPGKDDCVLYTCFGGPAAERDVDDPSLPEKDVAKSIAFWKQHALAQELKKD